MRNIPLARRALLPSAAQGKPKLRMFRDCLRGMT
jgi:hypothetical protein